MKLFFLIFREKGSRGDGVLITCVKEKDRVEKLNLKKKIIKNTHMPVLLAKYTKQHMTLI